MAFSNEHHYEPQSLEPCNYCRIRESMIDSPANNCQLIDPSHNLRPKRVPQRSAWAKRCHEATHCCRAAAAAAAATSTSALLTSHALRIAASHEQTGTARSRQPPGDSEQIEAALLKSFRLSRCANIRTCTCSRLSNSTPVVRHTSKASYARTIHYKRHAQLMNLTVVIKVSTKKTSLK